MRNPCPFPYAPPPSLKFLTTLLLSAVLGLGLWLLFEIKRNKRSVYAPRPAKLPHRAPPALAYGPLRWVWTVAALPGSETLRLAGTFYSGGVEANMCIQHCPLPLRGYFNLDFCRGDGLRG